MKRKYFDIQRTELVMEKTTTVSTGGTLQLSEYSIYHETDLF